MDTQDVVDVQSKWNWAEYRSLGYTPGTRYGVAYCNSHWVNYNLCVCVLIGRRLAIEVLLSGCFKREALGSVSDVKHGRTPCSISRKSAPVVSNIQTFLPLRNYQA